MTRSSHMPHPPITEAIGDVMARDIKGPPVDRYASEVPMAFLRRIAIGSPQVTRRASGHHRALLIAALCIAAIIALLLARGHL